MIKTRLISLVPDSKKYIFCNVLLQWLGMLSNVWMILVISQIFEKLKGGEDVAFLTSIGIIISTIIIRGFSLKFSQTMSFYASKSVKRTLRGKIFEKLLQLGSSYRQNVSTAQIVQLAGEGVEQLETYFGNYLPQFFYAMLAPLTLFIVMSRISLKVAITLLVCSV